MFDIGFWELTIIALVALLVVGPERLPRLARTLGLWLSKGRRIMRNLKDEIDREIQTQDIQKAAQAVRNPLGNIMDETADSLQTIKQDTEKKISEARSQFEAKKKDAPPASSDGAHDDA